MASYFREINLFSIEYDNYVSKNGIIWQFLAHIEKLVFLI